MDIIWIINLVKTNMSTYKYRPVIEDFGHTILLKLSGWIFGNHINWLWFIRDTFYSNIASIKSVCSFFWSQLAVWTASSFFLMCTDSCSKSKTGYSYINPRCWREKHCEKKLVHNVLKRSILKSYGMFLSYKCTFACKRESARCVFWCAKFVVIVLQRNNHVIIWAQSARSEDTERYADRLIRSHSQQLILDYNTPLRDKYTSPYCEISSYFLKTSVLQLIKQLSLSSWH